jgi:hypothetical protein
MTTAKCTIKNSTLLKIMQNMNPETWNNMQSDVDDHVFTQETGQGRKKWSNFSEEMETYDNQRADKEDGGFFSFTVIDIAANEIIIPYSRVCSSQTSQQAASARSPCFPLHFNPPSVEKKRKR